MHEYDYDTTDFTVKQDTTYIVVSQKNMGTRYYAVYQWNGRKYVQVTAYTRDIDRTFNTCQFLEEQHTYKKMSYVVPSTAMSN